MIFGLCLLNDNMSYWPVNMEDMFYFVVFVHLAEADSDIEIWLRIAVFPTILQCQTRTRLSYDWSVGLQYCQKHNREETRLSLICSL